MKQSEIIDKYTNWNAIFEHEQLTESFIEKNDNKSAWYIICKYQKLD